MGIPLSVFSRYGIALFVCCALYAVMRMYVRTPSRHTWRIVALALVFGGATGNLLDRLRWSRGVVDFIDVGFRDMRWPTFNVADMAVSIGAFLLAWVLWGEDRVDQPERPEGGEPEVATVPASPVSPASREI